MKQRFSYLDLRLVTNEVKAELTNCYLQNVYSLEDSSRHFLFKFDAGVNQSGKKFLMVDPGMRYHITTYQHEPTKQPSHFVQKLRKYLKNRRATDFWVAPLSRLMVVTFTEGQFYLVFEFFAGGNVVLLDTNHTILTLFRVVRDVGPNHQNYQIGEKYNMPEVSNELQKVPEIDQIREWVAKDKLGKALYSKISDPSSSMIEYYLREKGLDPKQKLTDNGAQDNHLQSVQAALQLSLEHAHSLINSTTTTPGYILYDDKGNSLEFEPFKEYFETVHPGSKIEEFSTYNATVDKYFGAILSDKGVNKVEQLHALAESRLEAARNERQKRVEGLTQQQIKNNEMGNTLLEHASTVEAVIGAVKALVDQGADWGDAENLIKIEKQKGNTVAQKIHSLQLDKNQVTIALDELKIPIQIDRSAYANARDYFEIMKNAQLKMEKTEQHADKALKSAEIKIKRDLEANLNKHRQAGVAAQLHSIRTPHWFEKFWWFLTSTNHLVIGARDEMQRDLLLRRYFQNGDLALTSDAPEATLLIIKNVETPDIPPQALLQAATFCVASSGKSWEAKSKAPCWYLTRKQVPRVNNNGDPISMRDFTHITPRNLVPPTALEMGMALLWQCEHPNEEGGASNEKSGEQTGDNDDGADGEEDFPDTQFDSDEEFPDTQLDSDADNSDDEESGKSSPQDSSSDSDASETASETASPPYEPSAETNAGEVEPEPTSSPQAEAQADAQVETEGSTGHEGHEDLPGTESDEDSGTPQPNSSALPKKVRGGKKKLRKYMQQDDEDRRLAMERLGTMKGLQRKAAEQEAKENARREQQNLLKQRKDRRRETELAYIKEHESSVEVQSHPEDLLYKYDEEEPIIAAVPMFAPWTSMQKAEYKVKLTFGSMKKGKASSEIMKILLKTGNKPPSEREEKLVDGIRQVDVQQAIAVTRVQVATTVASAKGSSKGNATAAKKKGNATRGKKKK